MARATFPTLRTITIAVTIVVAETQFGPRNIERTEGNTNEFIPCPFVGTTTPFWKINDAFYYHTRLPRPFIASSSPSGLLITVVERSINGTSFQCFAAGTGPGASVMKSSVGVLTVKPDPQYTGDREDSNSMSTPNIIYINYQELLFSSSKFYLGWNLFDQKNTVQNSRPGLRYFVVSSTCNPNDISTRINATGTTAVIPLDGDENLYYSIIALNETSRLNEPFWINAGVVTMKKHHYVGSTCPVCVSVPQPEKIPFFNIPHPPGSNRRDSLCKSVPADEKGRCLDLASNCDGFSVSLLSSSVTVCSSTMSSSINYEMCFSNITNEMNGTKIHFFYSTRNDCPTTATRVTSTLYIESLEIVAQDPIIDVTANVTKGELCLTSLPDGCFTTTVYIITIFDVTGCAVYTQTDIEDGVCTKINFVKDPNPMCAPYEIVIDAHNELVTYPTKYVYLTVDEELSNNSLCDCAQTKAQVHLRESTASGIMFSCNTDASYQVRFSIVATDCETDSKVFTSELLSCAVATEVLQIANLICNRQYLVSAIFAFSNGSLTMCLLSNTVTIYPGDCPTNVTNIPTTTAVTGPTNNSILAVLAIPTVLPLILIVLVIVIVVLVVQKYLQSGVYRPQHAEDRRRKQIPMDI